MIFAALGLFLVSLLMSGFFSGSETGMYRVSRTRLILDALGGSRGSRVMIWLLNRPAVFVATALVGNNIANFLSSFATVWLIGILFQGSSAAELIGPILMTPVVFIFGELLPKHWFFHAPYRLLHRVQPLLVLATILFLPISMLLALLGKALSLLTGQTPFRLRLAMARGDVAQLLRAGEEAGILHAAQRTMAEHLFETGNEPALSFAVPVQRLAAVDAGVDVATAQSAARRKNHPILLVSEAGQIKGYVRYAELIGQQTLPASRPVVTASVAERHFTTLLRMYDSGSEVALLQDENQVTRSVVTRRQLLQSLK
ncbi:hypothetical protein SV7mr_09870 [Stieleria bergensis]|uniref:CNNM transmembrane domain-containing protein n=1 Tax=Stieleria bergensis TaxID=2528025 RepID=A0A517SQT1_9BACT|nr:hypothetical protein SV7mr_09870 [Planctomycetes bacterium SV_7m_r]